MAYLEQLPGESLHTYAQLHIWWKTPFIQHSNTCLLIDIHICLVAMKYN